VQFIESNRAHLIQRMGMITVKQIADDLLACHVMSCEEMNTIVCEKLEQEASRMMIYMILNKGSEACDILVKSLEKHNPFLFHDLQGYRGLIDGIKKLGNAEGLVLDNISMDEGDAKKLAEGIRNLRKLRLLHMNHLTAIGDGITYIVKSVSDELSELEEIQLVNCCISSDAVEILAQNLCNLPKPNVLDLSENYLEEKGKDAIHRLVDGVNVLPEMKVLMLPGGDDVKACLTKLLELLETMPQLTKLGLRKWSLTDVEIRILG
ncbi:NLR family CARD domain-containing protein 4, partial [Podiceps cristatus]